MLPLACPGFPNASETQGCREGFCPLCQRCVCVSTTEHFPFIYLADILANCFPSFPYRTKAWGDMLDPETKSGVCILLHTNPFVNYQLSPSSIAFPSSRGSMDIGYRISPMPCFPLLEPKHLPALLRIGPIPWRRLRQVHRRSRPALRLDRHLRKPAKQALRSGC